MSIKDKYKVQVIKYKLALQFCKKWHYSGTVPPCKYYFGLFDNAQCVGVACYGHPANRNQKKAHGVDLELRRLCCIDDTLKNTESYFIASTLKLIKRTKKHVGVISLADPNKGHSGTIYRAANFTYKGLELGGETPLMILDGKEISRRSLFNVYDTCGMVKLSRILGDRIAFKKKKKKHVFVYYFNRKATCQQNKTLRELVPERRRGAVGMPVRRVRGRK